MLLAIKSKEQVLEAKLLDHQRLALFQTKKIAHIEKTGLGHEKAKNEFRDKFCAVEESRQLDRNLNAFQFSLLNNEARANKCEINTLKDEARANKCEIKTLKDKVETLEDENEAVRGELKDVNSKIDKLFATAVFQKL